MHWYRTVRTTGVAGESGMFDVSGLRRKLKDYQGDIRFWLVTTAVVLVTTTAVAQPFAIPSGSMEPTLLVGDRIAANKYVYGYSKFASPIGLMPDFKGRIWEGTPERGDIAVFRLPGDPSVNFVKRVIGLPGDRIQMRGGELYINGAVAPRRAVDRVTTQLGEQATRYIETLPNGRTHEIIKTSSGNPLNDTPEFVVPANSYFMMGDNRDNSFDSRVAVEVGGVGFVPAENLVGRVDRVVFSLTPFDGWISAVGHLSELRISRLFQAVE
jgi:signal peptidase I